MFSRLDFLIPTVFLTIAGTLGTVFFFLKKEDKDISVKVFILYTVSSLLLSGLLGLTGLISIQEPITMFLLLQGAFLLFGALHAFSLYKLNSWSTQESFWHEFVFTLYIAIVGALAF
ncbi:MAG TPA: TssN family type VI secretion system protein, partial [Chitinophagales bacterium]|nr:TssN family type VI secretion system protein [Chitinophagales bacterium]